MPQFANFTVKDGSATPADVSYFPEKLSSSETVLVDRREVSRDLQPSIEISYDPASSRRKTFKVQHDFAYPLVRVSAGVAVSSDIARARVVYTLPASMTQAERKHLHALVQNTQANVLAKAGIVDLDPLY